MKKTGESFDSITSASMQLVKISKYIEFKGTLLVIPKIPNKNDHEPKK